MIVPGETHPSKRPYNSPPNSTMPITDMAQMATYVYDYYISKVQAMKSAFYVSIESHCSQAVSLSWSLLIEITAVFIPNF